MDTCPERHVLLLEAATAMSLLVRALLLVILFFLKKVMQEVVQVKAPLVEVLFLVMKALSLFTSPPTPTIRPCGACLTQNISKAGDPDLGRGERTNW